MYESVCVFVCVLVSVLVCLYESVCVCECVCVVNSGPYLFYFSPVCCEFGGVV